MPACRTSHTQAGDSPPWLSSDMGRSQDGASKLLGADRDHHASLPATDCTTWTLMLPAGRYVLHLLDASFFPLVPSFYPSGDGTHLSLPGEPCPAALGLWGPSSSEVLPSKKAHSDPRSPHLPRAQLSQGLKNCEGFLCEPWKGLRKRKLA